MKVPFAPGELSDRDRRVLIIGILMIGGILLWYGGMRPFLAASEERRAELDRERILLREEQILLGEIEQDSAIRRKTAAAANRLRARLFRTHSAAASLTEYAVTRGDTSRVHIARTDPSFNPPSRDSATIQPVSVRIWGETDFMGLIKFLASLEGGEKLLDLRELRIESAPPTARDTLWEILSFEMQVTGYTDAERAEPEQ